MKLLVACESSGIVREAFAKLGWDAWSCDLLPTDQPGQHIQGDVRPLLLQDWDLIIAHPPCTFLTNSSSGWLVINDILQEGRYTNMVDGADFFALFWHCKCSRVAIENPVMHGWASDYLKYRWNVPKYTQIVNPWQYGHGESKKTCLWLRGLPELVPTNVVSGRVQRLHKLPPSPTRWKERSKTYQGIANAMAQQWTKAIHNL